jgi:hypothetical protein
VKFTQAGAELFALMPWDREFDDAVALPGSKQLTTS